MEEKITGTIDHITYYDEVSGFGVLRVQPHKPKNTLFAGEDTITVVGIMPELRLGEEVEFHGKWVEDRRYGRQFRVSTAIPIRPTSEAGLVAYIGGDLVRGIGPVTAKRIVDHFGTALIDILDHEPQRIHEVPGLKSSLADALIAAWQQQEEERSTLIFLQGLGISGRIARRIYNTLGPDTRAIVEANPYELADSVYGIGFKKADQIARNMGIALDAAERVRAGILYVLHQLAGEGHTFSPLDTLIDQTLEMLDIDEVGHIQAQIDYLAQERRIIIEQITLDNALVQAIYLPLYHRAESGAAERIETLLRQAEPSPIQEEANILDWDSFLTHLAKHNDVELSELQQSAVRGALSSRLSVLTGGPGTGKTTAIQMIIAALETLEFSYYLASPTGRAAKRLGEATGRKAQTIHRLLGYSPQEGFLYNESYPLKTNMVIIDEASMMDVLLFYQLLRALPDDAHLMLVGDVDQLPSVGAGYVLHDVIHSGRAHVTRLNQIFRQREKSHIVINAHRVNQGQVPYTDNNSDDFFFFGAEEPQQAADLIVDIVANRLPAKFGVDPIDDVQVIAPMYRGAIGVNTLNERLQSILNSDSRAASIKIGPRTFRVGDKVMQTRNDYDREIFNGDIGRIYGIDYEEKILIVNIDGRLINYRIPEDTDALIHAYCISTHRSQGAEYPVVVMPVLYHHYIMLQRNLLYTAITRAKQVVVLVGQRKAIHYAVQNNKVAERFSGLLHRLKS